MKDLLITLKILIVEDEPDNANVLELLLTHLGASVATAQDGKAGLAIVEREIPDLIISDLSMPEMDGWVFLERLQADPRCATIPVIALTAHAMPGDKERVMEAGFTNYVSKPIHVANFIPEFMTMLKQIPSISTKIGG